jgi:hypothetical protein
VSGVDTIKSRTHLRAPWLGKNCRTKLKTSFVLGFLLSAFFLPRLHAQSVPAAPVAAAAPVPVPAPTKAHANTNTPLSKAPVANAAPAGQAPDEATRKLAELVHAGRYAEAQQLTTGLLLAYPGDPRLIKGHALLEKLLSPAGSAIATALGGQPPQPAATGDPGPLSGMDKIDYNALIELAKQAQQSSDVSEQKTLLQQFMDQSDLFLQMHPAQVLLWQLRAASAISLDRPLPGYEAGQKLLAMGAADSDDTNLQHLLAQLKNKGWLDEQQARKLYEQQRYILVVFLGEAADKPSNVNLRAKLAADITALLANQYPSRQIRFTNPAPGDPEPILTVTINVHDTALSPCTYSMFKNVWQCPAQSAFAVDASGPQGWQFNNTYTITGGTSGVGWGTPRTPFDPAQLDSWISGSVLGVFKGILNADAVRASLGN